MATPLGTRRRRLRPRVAAAPAAVASSPKPPHRCKPASAACATGCTPTSCARATRTARSAMRGPSCRRPCRPRRRDPRRASPRGLRRHPSPPRSPPPLLTAARRPPRLAERTTSPGTREARMASSPSPPGRRGRSRRRGRGWRPPLARAPPRSWTRRRRTRARPGVAADAPSLDPRLAPRPERAPAPAVDARRPPAVRLAAALRRDLRPDLRHDLRHDLRRGLPPRFPEHWSGRRRRTVARARPQPRPWSIPPRGPRPPASAMCAPRCVARRGRTRRSCSRLRRLWAARRTPARRVHGVAARAAVARRRRSPPTRVSRRRRTRRHRWSRRRRAACCS